MGYNTRYSLKAELMIGGKVAKLEDASPLDALIAELRAGNEEALYVLADDGSSEDSGKWYEHQEDMRKFSALHSNILFTLHGEGEENDDLWNEYYLNGKLQIAKAQIQIAPFDPKGLR
jgi:hypothetical protein